MTCDEFDHLRHDDKTGGVPSTEAARRHLEHCDHCRAIEALRHMPGAPVEVPAELESRITRRAVSGLTPVSPLPSDGALIGRFLLLVVVAVVLGTLWLGTSGWNAMAPRQAGVVFSLLGIDIFLIAQVVTWQMVPGSRQRIDPITGIAGVFVAIAVATLLFSDEDMPKFMAIGLKCWARGVAVSVGAALLLYPVLRRSAWLSPIQLGAATGCLAGLTALTVLEIYCPFLNRGHILLWHLGASLASTLGCVAIGAAVARYRNLNSPVLE